MNAAFSRRGLLTSVKMIPRGFAAASEYDANRWLSREMRKPWTLEAV